MSTYVTRFVEVKVSDIKGKVLNITELDNIHDEGSIYYVVSGKEWGYYKCIDGKWVRTNDVPQKWVLAQNVVSTKYRHYKKIQKKQKFKTVGVTVEVQSEMYI